MRGSDLNKAIYNSNFFIKKTLFMSYSFYNILILIFFYFKGKLSSSRFIISTIPELLIIFFILKISKPLITKNNNIEELVNPGTSLSGKGIPSILFDGLVITMLVKFLIFYSYWFCLLYLLIIAVTYYELIHKTFKKLKKY